MLTSAELREDSRMAKEAALRQSHPLLKRALAERALQLAQLAEKIEREPR
jgi:hypothetical protein